MRFYTRIGRDDRGAGMVEYALITSLIALMSFSAVTLLGESTEDTFTHVTDALAQEGGSGGSSGSGSSASDDSSGGGGPTTSTTAPTTTTSTTAPTTTTTAPTTTTTAPTTTTTTAPAAPLTQSGTQPSPSDESSEITSWDNRDDEGSWEATVTYSNDWIHDQYLTIEITEVDHRGRTEKVTKTLVVPAGGSSPQAWEADFREHRNGSTRGVVTVKFDVVSIETLDANGDEQVYSQSDQTTTVEAPELP